MPSLLLHWERTPVHTEWEDGWPQSRSGLFGEEKSLFPLPGFEPWTVQSVAWSLYRMHYSGSDSVVHVYNLSFQLLILLLFYVAQTALFKDPVLTAQ